MMFSKLSAFAVFIPLASALTITTPTNWTSGNDVVAEWTTSAGDPSTWSFELVNADVFHQSFAIANNVNPSSGSLTIALGIVPVGDGYTLEAVNITNIGQIFAQTGDFAIGATVSTSSSAASTSSASGSSTSASGSTVSGSATSSTTGFGTTVSTSSAPPSSSSGSSSGTSSSSSATPSSFNGGGSSGAVSNSIASWVSMMFAAVAGAVVAL